MGWLCCSNKEFWANFWKILDYKPRFPGFSEFVVVWTLQTRVGVRVHIWRSVLDFPLGGTHWGLWVPGISSFLFSIGYPWRQSWGCIWCFLLYKCLLSSQSWLTSPEPVCRACRLFLASISLWGPIGAALLSKALLRSTASAKLMTFEPKYGCLWTSASGRWFLLWFMWNPKEPVLVLRPHPRKTPKWPERTFPPSYKYLSYPLTTLQLFTFLCSLPGLYWMNAMSFKSM